MLKKCVLCLLLMASGPAIAQTPPGQIEITPFGAYTFGGSFSDLESDISVKLKDSPSYGLMLDFRHGFNTQWEIIYSQQSTEADIRNATSPTTPLDMKIHYIQGGGTYQGDGDKVRPYLAATVGAAHFDVTTPDYDSDTFFSFSIAPGIQIMPSSRFGIRLEARAWGTLIRSGTNLFCISDPGGGSAGCAVTLAGEVFWQIQTTAGFVFRF